MSNRLEKIKGRDYSYLREGYLKVGSLGDELEFKVRVSEVREI